RRRGHQAAAAGPTVGHGRREPRLGRFRPGADGGSHPARAAGRGWAGAAVSGGAGVPAGRDRPGPADAGHGASRRAMNERVPIRRSTLALIAFFIAATGVYALVRPDPTPPVVYVPAVPRSPSTPSPSTPTTVRPSAGVTTTTVAPSSSTPTTEPSTSRPALSTTSSTSRPSPSTT